MKTLNLILRFRLAVDAELQVKGASRIIIDGSGNLVLHNLDDALPERINLAGVHSLSIQAMHPSSLPAPKAHAA
jgi:hypothetical protein